MNLLEERTHQPVLPHAADPAEPVWMLRINPLRRKRLADPELAGLLERLARHERELTELGDLCCDRLYHRIGSTPDGQRAVLVAARRAVHNGRVPAKLPDPVPEELLRWLDLRARRDAVRAEAVRAHPAALDRERATLSRLLGDEDLLRSLALIAPEVHRAAVRYREGTASRAAKSERGLLQYVTRAMMRTSPLARFTAVGLAVPAPDGVAPDDVAFLRAHPVTVLERVMFGYVAAGTAGREAPYGPDTWVRQPPTLLPGPAPDRISFLVGGEDGAKRVSTQLTRPVRLLLDATEMGPRALDRIASDLVEALRCGPEQAGRLVVNALRAGFLCTAAGPEDCADDPLEGPEGPRPALREGLGRLAHGRHGSRAAELRGLAGITEAMSHAVRRPAKVTVVEDYVVPPTRVATDGLRRPLGDLAHTVEFLSVFDRLHDVRAVLTEVFVRRFGAGADVRLTDHARELVRAVNAQVLMGCPALAPLREMRIRILEELRADLRARGSDPTEVAWEAERLAALADPLPDRFRREPLSYGVLVQPCDGMLVFNDSYAGHGMLYGRFLGPDAELGGEALSHLRRRLLHRYTADHRHPVEDRGLYRVNVNAHVPVLDDQLHAEDWYRLRLVHDTELDQLDVVDQTGRRLHVLTLGTGHPELYPAPLRLANWLVSGGRLRPDLGLADGLTGGLTGGVGDAAPRIRAGAVVLQRRRFRLGPEFEEAVRRGPGDADRLVELTRWRARHRVPAEVVLKPLPEPAGSRSVSADRRPQDQSRQRKPQYVDLTGALLGRTLSKFLERDGYGFLEEALPGAGQSPHAFEWVVEISRPAGGRFAYTGLDDGMAERHRDPADQGERACE